MMWEYSQKNLKQLKFLYYRLKRQKKNLFRRKRISIYRLKTRGFGFLNSAELHKTIVCFLKKKQKLFYVYGVSVIPPETYFKNTTKLQAVFETSTPYLFLNFFFFFNEFFIANLQPTILVFCHKFMKSIFFFKLFFFKLFFFKLFFFKIKKILFLLK